VCEPKQLTDLDWKRLKECYSEAIFECAKDGREYEGEGVMTSLGYVDLWPDGDVTAFGAVVGSAKAQQT
jgi:hypothetical protein